MPVMTMTNVIAVSTALSASNRCPERSLSGRLKLPMPSAIRPSGTLTLNSQGQLATPSTTLAKVGPMVAAMAATMAFMPIARASRARGKM